MLTTVIAKLAASFLAGQCSEGEFFADLMKELYNADKAERSVILEDIAISFVIKRDNDGQASASRRK